MFRWCFVLLVLVLSRPAFSLTQAQANLAKLQNGNTAQDIAAAQATVDQARASLDQARAWPYTAP